MAKVNNYLIKFEKFVLTPESATTTISRYQYCVNSDFKDGWKLKKRLDKSIDINQHIADIKETLTKKGYAVI